MPMVETPRKGMSKVDTAGSPASRADVASRPKALFVLSAEAFDRIYGRPERERIFELADVYAPPQTRETVAAQPEVLAEAEVILSGWGAPRMDQAFLGAARNLKAVLYGAGSVRSFVTPEFWSSGIRLTSAYAANAVPVSEYTVAAVLFSLKKGWRLSQAVRTHRSFAAKDENRSLVRGAFGAAVGLVSLGQVGRLVRERLRPFDLNVLAYDPYLNYRDADDLDLELVSLEELFSRSDVVSVHTPLLDGTRGLITGALIEAMPHGATFINTARGAVVREEELIKVLSARPDLQAVLDVTDPEPPFPESPLYSLPNVVLTPHIAGSQGAECRRMGQYVAEELRRYVSGQPFVWEITEERAGLLA